MKLNYIKHKIANLISINKIVTIHYYELDKNFSFDGESHNFWEMVYVDSGRVEIEADNQCHTLNAGEVIFHRPNEFHTLRADKKTVANVFVISFVCSSESMDFFKGKVAVVPQKLKKYISTIIEESSQTFKMMGPDDVKLEMLDEAPIGGQQMIRIHLEQLLIMFIRNEQGSEGLRIFPTKENMENHLVSQIINMIDEKVYGRLSVEEICQELTYSRSYLSKIFKAFSGYTILEFIVLRKIKEAKKLIREDHYNFTQISDMLAFDNPHYFSRVFKRVTNMTPSEYKNSARKI